MYYSDFIIGSETLFCDGGSDALVAMLDSDGNWQWAVQAGGISDEIGYGIALNNTGNSYVTGFFGATATFGSYMITSSGYIDIYVAKLNDYVFAENVLISTEIGLSNYPNPFNPTTTISFSIPEESKVELSVFNIKGQKIRSLLSDQITAGEHSIVWNGDDESSSFVSSGVYLYKLNVNGKTEAVKKCLLLK